MVGKSRIESIHGETPVILVCPHGKDNPNTVELTRTCTERIDASALINHGFRKSTKVDVLKDQGDCHRSDQLLGEEVLGDEFLKPLKKMTNRGLKALPEDDKLLIFYISVFDEAIEKKEGRDIDVILGYGGHINDLMASHTCQLWRRDCFISSWTADMGTTGAVWIGMPGGPLSGRQAHNMTQYYRKYDYRPSVESVQLMFSPRCCRTPEKARNTGLILAGVIKDLLIMDDSYDAMPKLNFV